MLKVALASFAVTLFAVACTTEQAQQGAAGSQVTAIDLKLPAQSTLAPELKDKKLGYCFEATSDVYAPTKGEDPALRCQFANYEDRAKIRLEGAYDEKASINAKLNRNEAYALTLVIAELGQGGKISDTRFYQGSKSITPDDMVGKDKLAVVIDLDAVGPLDGKPTVSTESIDVDVTVEGRIRTKTYTQTSTATKTDTATAVSVEKKPK